MSATSTNRELVPVYNPLESAEVWNASLDLLFGFDENSSVADYFRNTIKGPVDTKQEVLNPALNNSYAACERWEQIKNNPSDPSFTIVQSPRKEAIDTKNEAYLDFSNATKTLRNKARSLAISGHPHESSTTLRDSGRKKVSSAFKGEPGSILINSRPALL